MNQIAALYFEETEELLQKVEFLLIELETNYSINEINELFRIVHSIKGSSQMMGYEHIGNLTHKIEDMLDKVRKHELEMNSEVLRLCFEGFDLVKSLFEVQKFDDEGSTQSILAEANKIEQSIEKILQDNKAAGASHDKQHKTNSHHQGIISQLTNLQQLGAHRYFIQITLADDVQMVGATLFMIFNNIKEIGSIVYTNVTDEDITGLANEKRLSTYEILLSSELDKAELYPYLEITYVDKVAIVDIGQYGQPVSSMPNRKNMQFYAVLFEVLAKLKSMLSAPIVLDKTFKASINEQRAKVEGIGKLFSSDATIQTLTCEITTFFMKCNLIINNKKSLLQIGYI